MKTILNHSLFPIISVSVIILFCFACDTPDKKGTQTGSDNSLTRDWTSQDETSPELYAINASQYGTKYRETMILLQNRMGLRIEYCVDRSALEIWISPQVGKSYSYIDKNWSNRDDHTNVFDRILFPKLNLHEFDSCNWDPFHSIIFYRDQTLHISQVYNQPAVLVWFEKPGEVDFKIFGKEVERTGNSFIINHKDRDREFQSAAILSEGKGSFTHQLVIDENRSIYARAYLKPGQFLVIASELEHEQISEVAREIASKNADDILTRNEEKIAGDLSTGLFTFKDRPEMQKLLDKSRRCALSMQDFEGFMRSTNQYIYYLLWFRDGGMNTGHINQTGWTEPARQHVKFALQNPNISTEDPPGKYFGMTMAGEVTKFEEDGLFYAIWPTFNYWTQTGDDTFIKGEYLKNMEEGMNWLERYCYDKEKGLFGRYYYCETPYSGSRGDGFDNATGAPTYRNNSLYEGTKVVRAFDLYINILNYSGYIMLAAMESGKKAEEYLEKANNLDRAMQPFFDYEDPRPSYGYLLTEDGEMILSKPYGMDIWDYVWAMSLPPFTPTLPEKYKVLRDKLYHDMTTTSTGYFLCTYFALLTAMDSEWHNEEDIVAAMDKLVGYSIEPGKYLPMPYSMPEMFNISEKNPFHDVRPLVYSIAPWMSAVTNMGIRNLPFGIAVRGSNYLANLENYVYLEGLFDVRFEGSGKIDRVVLNGEPLLHTYQVPVSRVKKGDNDLVVTLSEDARTENMLISSTVELQSIEEKEGGVIYHVKAYGKNVLYYKNLDKEAEITDARGNGIDRTKTSADNITCFEFEGRGEFIITCR